MLQGLGINSSTRTAEDVIITISDIGNLDQHSMGERGIGEHIEKPINQTFTISNALIDKRT